MVGERVRDALNIDPPRAELDVSIVFDNPPGADINTPEWKLDTMEKIEQESEFSVREITPGRGDMHVDIKTSVTGAGNKEIEEFVDVVVRSAETELHSYSIHSRVNRGGFTMADRRNL